MEEKIDGFLRILYPNYDQLKDDKKVQRDKDFIRENIEKIEDAYNEVVALGATKGAQETIRATINTIKSEKYINMLYPDLSKINQEDKSKVIRNMNFIHNNTEEIEDAYNEVVALGATKGAQETIRATINNIKSEKYINMLYPDFSKINQEDKSKVIRNMNFIHNNTEEIEDAYNEVVALGATEGAQETIEATINRIKEEREYTRQITTEEIGKATINARTELKGAASKVENKKEELLEDKDTKEERG